MLKERGDCCENERIQITYKYYINKCTAKI